PKLTTVRGANVSIGAQPTPKAADSPSATADLAGPSTPGLLALAPAPAAAGIGPVQWVGGSGDWNTASNWSTGKVPGPDDDVVINVPASISVTISSGSQQARSLQSQEALTIATGAALTVTGASAVQGALVVAQNATLTAQGDAASFQASAATTINGANLFAI